MALVLIVDDDIAGLEIRKLILEHAGHRVICASEATQALMECRAISPDCAIVDVRLPKAEDGLALIRELRTITALRLIVLCGYPADLESRPERDLVDELLCKPVRPDQLLRAVDRHPAVKLKTS